MDQKVCFISGGNSGIGKAAAIQIANSGYYVLIGSRSYERGIKALEEIREKSGSNMAGLIVLDMSSKTSVYNASNMICEKFGRLDVIIHNAADFDISRKEPQLTDDGIESIWATNHIGPILLTSLLLDLLQQSPQGRIITIASKGLMLHPGLKVDLKDPEFKTRKFSVPKAYYQSKLAQIMFTYWLAEKLKDKGVTVNCIRVTNVKIDLQRYPGISGLMKFLYAIKSKFSISPEEMAKTYTYLATANDVGRISGKYFNEKNKMVNSSFYSKDEMNIKNVMSLSEAYIKKLSGNQVNDFFSF